MMRSSRRVLALLGALMLLLTGCSGSEANDADIEFATQMIPHHQQAVEMSELAETRAKSETVVDLAARIKGAQDPEIKQLTAMLERWGEDAPDAHSGGHGSGEHGMPGMMAEGEMTAMEKASGSEFDKLYLEMMIRHHEGAIEMAEKELADGSDAEAKKLAEKIKSVQQDEIDEMNALFEK